MVKESLVLIKVMDTNEHESHKDVALVKNARRQKLILRIGEIRTENFWPRGYQGKYFVAPRLYKTARLEKVVYEIEEYLPGWLLSDILPKPRAAKVLPQDILKKLILAHWEFQSSVASTQSSVNWSRKNLEKFYHSAKKFLEPDLNTKIKKIIYGRGYQKYWQAKYPCKWKFSIDNLILMPDGRIGFIDLARVGKRFWGYDLGWLFWPAWHHFRNSDFKNSRKHIQHLHKIFKLVYKLAPAREKRRRDFYKRCWLIVLERCLGALYDIDQQTAHIVKNLSSINRQKSYRNFVLGVLVLGLENI